MNTKTEQSQPVTVENVTKVCQDLEARCGKVAIFVVPAETVHELGGGKGNDLIPVTMPFRELPWDAREKELIAWNKRRLNDTAGDKDLTRAERAKKYQTAVRNLIAQNFTRAATVDPLLRELRDTVVRHGTPRKLAKDMTEKTLRNMLPPEVVALCEEAVSMQERIAEAMKAARK